MIDQLKQFASILDIDQYFDLQKYVEASRIYYVDNDSEDVIMSDTEFDELKEEIVSWNIPEITIFVESRIYKDGEGMVEVDEQFNQRQEMISLFKIKFKDMSSISEIRKFFVSNRKPLWYGPKFDGGALKINFQHKIFPKIERIISRGGVDCTKNFENLPSIIDAIKYQKEIVAGELVIKKTVFNEKYSIEGDNDYEYENARNFVGSLIKKGNIPQKILDDLVFIPCTDGTNPLEKTFWKPFSNEDMYRMQEIVKFYKSDEFPYLCDGIVIAYYEDGERQVKDNYPLNMVAIKFPALRVKSKVIGFEWTQKKSGKLTPKIMIEPVKHEGSTLTCANGYNYQNVLDKCIGIGSEVEVEKSGDIIPIIAKVLTRSQNVTLPECDYRQEGKHLIAMNLEESRKYKFILGLQLFQLDGVGPVIADQIGQICDYDIIQLFDSKHKPDICSKLGGGSNWRNFSEFYNIKNVSLDKLIHVLQFNDVGPKIALKAALLITKKSNDTSNMSSFVISHVCRGEGFTKIIESVRILKTFGIVVSNPVEINEDTIIYEMTVEPGTQIIVDGKTISKSDFMREFKKLYPNAVHSTLTRETTYLFTNDLSSTTGKSNKARKYNVKIVLYSQALKKLL